MHRVRIPTAAYKYYIHNGGVFQISMVKIF